MNADTITQFLKSIGYTVTERNTTRETIGFEKQFMPYAADMIGALIVDLYSGTFSFIATVGKIEVAIRDLTAEYFLQPEYIEEFSEMEEVFKHALKKVVF